MVWKLGAIDNSRGEVGRRQVVPPAPHKTHCVDCPLFDRCLPFGLDGESVRRLDEMIGRQRRLHKGEVLFHAGTDLHAIHIIHCGSFRTRIVSEDGREQITGYHISGEVIGCDGISTNSHNLSGITGMTPAFLAE